MSKQKNGLVPVLRFPEFIGETKWCFEQFDKIYEFKSTNSLSRDKLNSNGGTVKNIHYGDIHTKFSTLFDITSENVPYINDSKFLEKLKPEAYCRETDIIFADASENMEDIGKSIEIININNERLISGLHTLLARQKNQKLIKGFGGHLFNATVIRMQIQKEAQGTKVLSITTRRIASIKVPHPDDKKEQQKIADCLSSIDELIMAHTQKLNSLKAHKKALMQQLFPSKGESLPKLRFVKDDGADFLPWKSVKLEAVANRVINKNKGEKLFRVLTNSAVDGVVDQKNYFKKDIAVKGNLDGYYIVELGDYVYNPRISILAPVGPISKNKVGKGVISPLYTVFRFLNKNNDFYEQYFKYSNWHHFLQSVSNSGVRHDRISIKSNEFMVMPVPDLDEKEQQKIADCLSSLDQLIGLQNQKLESLKKHKKGLMQQLFPVISEMI
ncbi:restriction endonuclease subunit S [Arsenophonus nasoniae]|uniref:Restriction endonuclease subunit S n=1 Tax=Arsenophonus nasoniae TaxID=638 RepID=A0AA95GSL5_9GAMM|nr:restriction endonuclease subunit S [Arsenophonus nasoniae]WGM03281.1 restriction endonuclease subunit S [Arsenophonus nasoniae]